MSLFSELVPHVGTVPSAHGMGAPVGGSILWRPKVTCGGHAAPTHQYHLHSGVGMVSAELQEARQLPVDGAKQHSQLSGWMFDGCLYIDTSP